MILDYSKESEEEERLIGELNSLDECLYFKSFGNNINMKNEESLQKYGSFAKYHEIKQSNNYFNNQINNVEYFSQIGNKDEEYDTLFDQGSNFLAQMKEIKSPQIHSLRQIQQTFQLSAQNQKNNAHHHPASHQQNQQKNTKYPQILKEQEFIFKKQKKQVLSTVSKKNLPPNHKSLSSKTNMQIGKKLGTNGKIQNDLSNMNKNILKQGQILNITDGQCNTKEQKQQKNKNNEEKSRLKGNCKTEISQNKYETIQQYLQHIAYDPQRQKNSIKQKFRIQDKINYIYSDKNSLQCTFKPKILKKSQEMIKNSKGFVERLSINYDKKSEKIPYQPNNMNNKKLSYQRIEKLSQPRKQKMPKPEEIEEIPSFRPSLSKKSIQHMSNCTYDVATRNKLWLEQKEQKIAKLRKQQEQQKLRKQQLSHQPMIKHYKGEQEVYFSKFGKQGMVQYFQRLSNLKSKNVSCTNLMKENMLKKQGNSSFYNKQNASSNLNKQKTKKLTYEEAVKDLHSKIMKLKI